ncbi:bifunctional lysylphosphatidylglycerol flippase/synthetase MprF [Pandoraea sputorum]|uniref:Phosphatidylglycerol lysyltransferase n=1 Tax=Pandoraea sputorum TaxID=93222 RepID=A0A5E5B6T4_9BURK|nr:bifunctional lysylphosphatidylglycerol flippase/synthetase MprF [Pandoraea sputorum]VVE81619.1 transmembrane protein [Pandoraea sputorum]
MTEPPRARPSRPADPASDVALSPATAGHSAAASAAGEGDGNPPELPSASSASPVDAAWLALPAPIRLIRRFPWSAARPWLIVAGVLLLGLFVFDALHHMLRHVHYDNVIAAIHATPVTRLVLAMLATLASYAALTGYDISGLAYAGAKVKRSTVVLTSFIAYALGNSVGLGVLTGGTVRMRMYAAAGVDASKVAQAVAFNAGAFGLGMTVFGSLGMLWGASRVSALVPIPAWMLQAFALLLLAGAAAFLVLCARKRAVAIFGRWSMPLPPLRLAVRQLVISAADLGMAAAALWCLLPAGVVDLPTFVVFYAIAMALGVLSHVPGGVGVFEAVILLATNGHAPISQVAGALVLYRGIYYLLPLIFAACLLAAFELRQGPAAPIGRAAVRLFPGLLAALTLVAGVMLLISGVTPATRDAEDFLRRHVPLFLVEVSHLLGSVAGLSMLFLARGLLHRLDAAWWGSLGLTVIAAVLAIPKGIALSEFFVLAVLATLLLVSRKQFDRRSSLFTQSFEPGWIIAVLSVLGACTWLMFMSYRRVGYANQLWWQFTFDGDAPRSMRALMVVAVIGLGLSLWQLLRQSPGAMVPATQDELARAKAVIRKQPAADACLALMGDKSFLFSPSGNAFIMYAKHRRSWVSLSDPVGDQKEWPELIWRFIELADAHGGRAAFYKTRPQALPLYIDAGLRAYKLGEEAFVSLPEFGLQGARRANLRHGVTRGEREGLTLEIVPPENVAPHLAEMRLVSDAWLARQHTREKGFSLGAFDDAYIARQPVALVRREDRLVAFATLMCPDVQRIEASIDLMRQVPDSPPGTMDFLFAKLMLHFKAQGYQRFGLGMAPMSGMETHQLAPRWHRFGRMMFAHGARFYNFRGLRSFKDKFDPQWEARYLMTPGGIAPMLTLADVASLVGGGWKGMITK